jgi:hypothetical protein
MKSVAHNQDQANYMPFEPNTKEARNLKLYALDGQVRTCVKCPVPTSHVGEEIDNTKKQHFSIQSS